MAQVVLATRSTGHPKTQSALLECMEEHQATIDGTTYAMPSRSCDRNPEPDRVRGTFALPEAQLDRFMLRIRLGYPIRRRTDHSRPAEDHAPARRFKEVLSVDELRGLQKSVREIYVDPTVADYIVRLVNATRTHPDVYLGASPRGSLALYRPDRRSQPWPGGTT